MANYDVKINLKGFADLQDIEKKLQKIQEVSSNAFKGLKEGIRPQNVQAVISRLEELREGASPWTKFYRINRADKENIINEVNSILRFVGEKEVKLPAKLYFPELQKTLDEVYDRIKSVQNEFPKIAKISRDKIVSTMRLGGIEVATSTINIEKALRAEQERKKVIKEIIDSYREIGYTTLQIAEQSKIMRGKETNELKEQRKVLEQLEYLQKSQPELYIKIRNQIKDLNAQLNKNPEELSKTIRSIQALSSHSYRLRLEWDRIGNSLRFFSYLTLTSTGYAIRQTTDWIKGLMELQGSLKTSSRETLGLAYVSGVLGIQATFLGKTINNVYQALINAGQGTSFVAERVREAIHSVGLSSYKLGEDMGGSVEVFFRVIGALQKLEQQYGRAWVMQKLLGSNAENVAQLLQIPVERLREYYKTGTELYDHFGISLNDVYNAGLKVNEVFTRFGMLLKVKLAEVLPGLAEGFRVIIETITKLLELFTRIPDGLQKGLAQFFILGSAFTYVAGTGLKVFDTIKRISEALLVARTATISFISSFVTNPILLGLTLIAGGLTYIALKLKQYNNQLNELALKQQVNIKEAYDTSMELGESITNNIELIKIYGTAEEKQKLDVLMSNLRKYYNILIELYEKLRQGNFKTNEEYKETIDFYEVTYQIYAKTLEKIRNIASTAKIRTEKEYITTKQIQEQENLIRENNLNLNEQYDIWTNLLRVAKENSREYDTINKKIVDVVGASKRAVSETLKFLQEQSEIIPSWFSGIDTITDKFRNIENEVKVLMKTGTQENLQLIKDIQTEYTKALLVNYDKLLDEQRDKRLKLESELYEENIKAGRLKEDNLQKQLLNIYNSYNIEKLRTIKSTSNEVSFLEKKAQEAILEYKKSGDSKYLDIHNSVINLIKEKQNSLRLELGKIELKSTEDRISTIDKFYEEHKKGTDSIISYYSREISKLSKLDKQRISDQLRIIDTVKGELSYINNLINNYGATNKLLEQQVEIQNKLKEEILNFAKVSDEYHLEYANRLKENFEIERHSVSERTKFYDWYYNYLLGALIEVDNREKISLENKKRIFDSEAEIYSDRLKILSELLNAQKSFTSISQKIIDQYLTHLSSGYSKHYITDKDYVDNLEKLIGSSVKLIGKYFQGLYSESPDKLLRNFYYNTTQIISRISKEISGLDLMPEEKKNLFIRSIYSMLEEVKSMKLSKEFWQDILQGNQFSDTISRLGEQFGLSRDEIKIILSDIVNSTYNDIDAILRKLYEFGYNISIFTDFTTEKLKSAFQLDTIKNAFFEFSQSVLSGTQTIDEAFKNLKKAVFNYFQNLFVTLIISTKIFTSEVQNAIQEAVDLFLAGYTNRATNMINNIIGLVVNRTRKLLPFVQSVAENLRRAFGVVDIDKEMEKTTENLGKLGENIAEGIHAKKTAGWLLPSETVLEPETAGVGNVSINKQLSVNFHGLGFNEQKKVFDLWQDKEELSTILGV